jgi:dipicolinate synthase subunit A
VDPTNAGSIWIGTTVAIIGGDARETEMAALASDAGASVRRFGTPDVDLGRPAGVLAASVGEALDGARIAIGPIPYPGPDGRIFAPSAPAPLYITADDLRRMHAPGHLIIGKADDRLRQAASEAGVEIHEYEHDTELMLLRAPAIAEGAIRIAIERSPWTIHRSAIGVVGFGRTARALTRALLGLGARIHVVARRAEARAEANVYGADAHPFSDAGAVFPDLRMLFSTVPERVLTADLLEHLARDCLVVDMSAPPGGVDRDDAERLGLEFVWARGLGASAPRTVAASQWMGVTRVASEILGGPGASVRLEP